MTAAEVPISAARAAADGLSALFKPPFRVLVALALLVSVVSEAVSDDEGDAAFFALMVLFAISIYLQIATTLAAGRSSPDPRADPWVKAAFRRRCFWRFLAAGVLQVLLVGLAAVVGLVVGGFVVGGMVALAQAAATLERRLPADAIRRSFELTRPARVPVVILFTVMVLLPGVLAQVGYALGWDRTLGNAWLALSLAAVALGQAGTIALTRAFVTLGGTGTPPFDEMAPEPRPQP